MMDYETILKALNEASLFELFRLNAAIRTQLDDPAKNIEIKNQLRVGQQLSYFDSEINRLIPATVIEINRTRAVMKDVEGGKSWSIPFYQINIDKQNVDIKPSVVLDRNTLKVGDHVCFMDKSGHEIYGQVTKLNPKTAGILARNVQWRVSYSLLKPVVDGELGEQVLQGSLEFNR